MVVILVRVELPLEPLAALQAQNQRAGLKIGRTTLSTWRGESMDYGWAIDRVAGADGLAW